MLTKGGGVVTPWEQNKLGKMAKGELKWRVKGYCVKKKAGFVLTPKTHQVRKKSEKNGKSRANRLLEGLPF